MKKEDTFVDSLTTILVEQKLLPVTEANDLKELFKRSDHDYFDSFLIEEGFVSDADLLNALSLYYKVPFFDVVGYFFEHNNLLKFPLDVLLRNAMIPLEDDESTLVMVVADPFDPNLLIEIGNYVSYDIQFRVGLRLPICDAVKEFYDESLTIQDPSETLYDDPENPSDITAEQINEAEELDQEFIYDQEDEE